MDSLTVISGTNEGELLDGTIGDDRLDGGNGDDTLDGGDGDDLLLGGNGNDLLEGGDGDDRLLAGNGDDELNGGAGDDSLDGGNGDDLLDGGAGSDTLLAGRGDDTLNYTVSENIGAADVYDGGKGYDTLQLTLTSAELLLAQDDIDAFYAFLDSGGDTFQFTSFNLTVSGVEDLKIVELTGGNTPPVAQDDQIPGTLGPIRVAVVGSTLSTYVDAAAQLADSTAFDIEADPILITDFTTQAEWTAALAGYDVVVVGENGTATSDYEGTELFAALRGFVDTGGGVVSTGWFAGEIAAYTDPTVSADADYISPAAAFPDSLFTRSESITILDPAHPIAGGIPSYAVPGFPYAHELAGAVDSTATVLGESETGMLAAIAYDEVGQGLTVYLGSLHMANGAFGPETTRTGEADQIFEQAVAWAAGDRTPATTDEDTAYVIDDAILLANDTDADGDLLAVGSVAATSALGASISINAAGDIVYDPTAAEQLQQLAAGEVVEDRFDYTVIDGNGGEDIGTVSLSVAGRAEPAAAEGSTLGSFEESLYAGLDQPLASTAADADTLL